MLGKVDGMKAANNDQTVESRGEIEARLGSKAKVARTETWSTDSARMFCKDVEDTRRCSF